MGTVIGIGVDLEEVSRVERVFSSPKALARVFTAHEIAYCQPKRRRFQHLAVRFAAKEAVFKALGTGLSGGLHWTDAEVRNEPSGKPHLLLSGPAKALADRLGSTPSWCRCRTVAGTPSLKSCCWAAALPRDLTTMPERHASGSRRPEGFPEENTWPCQINLS